MTPTTERLETFVLAAILVVVAGAAGWASFTHVHDWTMHHAPTGTPDAFGWVNAVISELVPIAAFLTIRRRRRNHQPIAYPIALLIAAAALSLAAQLAVAQPSPSGWLLSAAPALAFMALVKLVFASTDPPAPAVASTEPAAVPVTETAPTATGRITEDDQASADVQAPADNPAPAPIPVRSPGVVPVPASAFTRLNGTPVIPEVTR